MDAAEVVRLVSALAGAGVAMWLMGGWAIDALTGRQRRRHDDLDVLVRDLDLDRAAAVLGTAGYAGEVGAHGASYLVDQAGRQVDVHAVALRSDGSGVYRMDDGTDWVYAPGAFDGTGIVLGRELRCLTPETMMIEHATGYELDDVHRADVAALAKAFGLAVPSGSLDSRPSS
jgi:lincosamide nucleotidyltransferase A/C/D/E